jgi:hypothetical protein
VKPVVEEDREEWALGVALVNYSSMGMGEREIKKL